MISGTQFSDATSWLDTLKAKGITLHENTIFTGHSLGGALATQAAVRYEASSITFSAPSAMNVLSPVDQLKINHDKVINFVKWGDAIPRLPIGVDQIGQQIMVKRIPHEYSPLNLFSFGPHMLDTILIEGDSLARGMSLQNVVEGAVPWAGELVVGVAGYAFNNLISSREYGSTEQYYDEQRAHKACFHLDEVINHVQAIKDKNMEIPERMKAIYHENLHLAIQYYDWALPVHEIEAIFLQNGLHYSNLYDHAEVENVDRLCTKEISELKTIKHYIEKIIKAQQEQDKILAKGMMTNG